MLSFRALSLSLLLHFLFLFGSYFLFLGLYQAPSKEILEIDLSEMHFQEIKDENTSSESQAKHSTLKSISKATPKKEEKTEKIEQTPKVLDPDQGKVILKEEVKEKISHEDSPDQVKNVAFQGSALSQVSAQSFKEVSSVEKGGIGHGSKDGETRVTKISHGEEGGSKYDREKQYLSQKLHIISELLRKHLEYPYLARRMGWQGDLVLSFVLTPSGEIKEIKIQKSTGFDVLDRAAKETLLKVSKYFPRPEVEVRIKVPISFKLN